MGVRADYKGSLGELLWAIGLSCTLILVVVIHTCINVSKVAKLHTKNTKFTIGKLYHIYNFVYVYFIHI